MSSSAPARASWAMPALLLFTFALFLTGAFFPFFHVKKFWVFAEAVSVVGGIITLFREGEYFLFAVLTLFTLVFPCAKLGLLALIWLERDHDLPRLQKLHGRVAALGKWSMLDVFIVAILIVTMKAAGLAQISIGLGLYLFTFSVVFTQLASMWLSRQLTAGHEPSR
jgi:paraquat-inducible protein A